MSSSQGTQNTETATEKCPTKNVVWQKTSSEVYLF